MLAFTSDHGTEFLDHGQHFHGHTVYGELNRIPMFFWGPEFVPAGVRIPTTVQNLDFMPTVLELAGLPSPEAAQGQSLVPWFEAGGEEAKAAGKGWRRAPAITEKQHKRQIHFPQRSELFARLGALQCPNGRAASTVLTECLQSTPSRPKPWIRIERP